MPWGESLTILWQSQGACAMETCATTVPRRCCQVASANVSSFAMKGLDQQEQWHQLTDTYRQMTEEELGRVAADAFDLVPIAQQALQAVISERGLKIQPASAPSPAPDPSRYQDDTDDPYKLFCVRTVHSESEARQLKALLD